jgi:penicillin-insensitive murein DD-endopeptidase
MRFMFFWQVFTRAYPNQGVERIYLSARFVLIFAVLCVVIGASPSSYAQTNGKEESERRANTLKNLPQNAAKRFFGNQKSAASLPSLQARSIGSYAKGCLAGAKALTIDGSHWQVMRINRNRNWGHPLLIDYLEKLAARVPSLNGWEGLLMGDISQPRGGPMLTGHASHQIGLDADIWLTPMPKNRLSKDEREELAASNMVREDWMDIDPKTWTPQHLPLIKAAAQDPLVERIFVNPAIKKALCREADADTRSDKAWLAKVRPMWGHNYHFHVRMMCPRGETVCSGQEPPSSGEGCGRELDDWLALQKKAMNAPKSKKPTKPKPEMSIDSLPAECRQVAIVP